MIKLLKFMKWWYWIVVVLMVGVVYGQVTLDLSLPEYIGNIIEFIGVGVQTGDSQTNNILLEGLKMLGVVFASVSCTVITSYIAARIGGALSRNIREGIYNKVDSFSMAEINDFSTPSLITRSTNDIQQVQTAFIIILRMAATAPIMAIMGISKIVGISSELSLPVAIGIASIVGLIIAIFIVVFPRYKKIQVLTDELNLVTRENLTGIRVIRAFNSENYQEDKFENVNATLTKNNLEVNRAMAFMMPGMTIIMNGVTLAIIWIGAILINNLTLGSNPMEGLALQTQFVTYAGQIIMSFMILIMLFIIVPRAQVSGKRISDVLQKELSIVDSPNTVKITDKMDKSFIQFKNVCFRYTGAEECVVKDFSLEINKGDTVAFIGSTGSGKSSLINLIPRFHDVSEGEILIHGVNVQDYSQEDLHQIIGYVPQSGTLFSGTIRSNMQVGKEDATDEEINEALDIANASEFVSQLELGLDAEISQGGKNFSGGQKQRLSIARAIVRNPEIYIFDDSFSALDYRTDKLLRKALNEKLPDSTKLIVAQRIGTILYADKIVVLEQGRLVGVGTHEELLKTCEVYKEIALSQLSQEEIDHGKN